ncbi:MAG: hypothetical protein SPF89_01540 [Sphaerochaetaceae bacterium]|nr:hypothetical protein [Spirochaetales bacterium]MDY5498768.1 hypothetical protein [Sphaerochaetaceae bacterium]
MKKWRMMLVALLLSCGLPLAAKSESGTKPFRYDFHLDTVFAFVRGSDFAPGGGLSLGIKGNVYGVEAYGMTEIMQKPGGSSEGRNASGEFMIEGGLRFVWNLFNSERVSSSFTLDAGYYAQHVSLPSSPNDYYRMHNGVMVRPAVGTVLAKSKFYQVEVGIGYQKTLLPAYTDYDGVVVFVKLF